jgi:putative DNA primase/helicase
MAKKKPKSEVVTIDDTAEQRLGIMFPHMWAGKPLATIENMQGLFGVYGITARYNVISKRCEINIPGEDFTKDNWENASLATIMSKMAEMRMPTTSAADYILRLADKNQYNPVMDWITSKEWDGVDRVPELCATIEAEHEEAKNLFIYRWLVTACSMALHEGVDSAGCLVLQGAQGLGKTWWIRKLVPDAELRDVVRTGANLNTRDRDSMSQFIRYWIAELGEIGSTFKRNEIDMLKAFITDSQDILRRPYGRGDCVYPRRTAIIASVNDYIYLHDATGNRRFWTIACKAVNSYHTVNMQQLWAQILVDVQKGESWQMTEAERAWVKFINESHAIADPICEMVAEKYIIGQEGLGKIKRTASSIAKDIGIKVITPRETRLIATFLRKMEVKETKSKGMIYYELNAPEN